MAFSKGRNIAVWVVSALLGLLFVAAGAGKFFDPQAKVMFVKWGWPDWLRIAVGVVELSGGALLLVPRAVPTAAALLAATMAGAAFTHLRAPGEALSALGPLLVIGGLAFVGWSRWRERSPSAGLAGTP